MGLGLMGTGLLLICLLGMGLPGLGVLGPRTAAADDEPAPDDPAAESRDKAAGKATGIDWAAGREAAQERAKREGKLLFAYFGRHNPG